MALSNSLSINSRLNEFCYLKQLPLTIGHPENVLSSCGYRTLCNIYGNIELDYQENVRTMY